jgi:hypothetical protein
LHDATPLHRDTTLHANIPSRKQMTPNFRPEPNLFCRSSPFLVRRNFPCSGKSPSPTQRKRGNILRANNNSFRYPNDFPYFTAGFYFCIELQEHVHVTDRQTDTRLCLYIVTLQETARIKRLPSVQTTQKNWGYIRYYSALQGRSTPITRVVETEALNNLRMSA